MYLLSRGSLNMFSIIWSDIAKSVTEYVLIISISSQIFVQMFSYQKYTNSNQYFINILDKRIIIPAVKCYSLESEAF